MIKRIRFVKLILVIITLLSVVCLSAGSAKEGSGLSSEAAMREAFASAAQDNSPRQVKTAEEVYKNIQVLKGVPASQLDSVMAFFTGSLGVRCNHCHVPGQFEKDDKQTKQTARRMIRMVFDLNKGSFDNRGAVTCVTCHRGQTKPANVPTLGQSLWLPSNTAATAKQDAPLPSVDEVLERYVRAVGGKEAVEKVTSRAWKGSRVGADGVLVPEEGYAKAPNKMLTVTSYPSVVFRTGFNGAQGWMRSSQQGGRDLDEAMLAQLRREAEFYKETRLREWYTTMAVLGRASVGEREAYVVEATPSGGGDAEKLFFDVQTGLLVRKYSESKTMLGQFPSQIDYEDYRDVDGVKLPFSIRWAIPGRTWGRKVAEVKQNIQLDDAQFNPPTSGK